MLNKVEYTFLKDIVVVFPVVLVDVSSFAF